MSETKIARDLPLAAPNPLFLRDEELTLGIELLERAHRALVAEPDRRLSALGLGHNHRWVIYFIGRHPGITMAELQGMVQVTKQTLSRLLKELVGKGLVGRTPNQQDRRQRMLELTEAGRSLDEELNRRLRRRLAQAYRAAGAEAVAGHHRVLLGLIGDVAFGGSRGNRG